MQNDLFQHSHRTSVNSRLKENLKRKPDTNILIALVFCLAFNSSRFITDACSETLLMKSFTSCILTNKFFMIKEIIAHITYADILLNII